MSLCLGVLFLAGCGFQPIYGRDGDVDIQKELTEISVLPIKDRAGQQLHNHLLDSLNPFGRPKSPKYRLSIQLTETRQELAVQKTELATRVNLSFNAQFQLSAATGVGSSLFSGRSRIVASYNILSSDYATIVAEQDARSRAIRELSADITNRLAAFLQLSQKK
ncbi:MAG: LPS assembly lipoprotein LptE [Proteobacteria bacterium]|nr:LPS assembly lipoprotein LptE [Pseudomonadota bacterium]